MTTPQQIVASINEKTRAKGGHYAQYSCKTVSWDDVQRGTVGGGLSCFGSNITDTRLWAKDGRSLFTVRSDNWNERLGKTNTSSVAVVASGTGGGAGGNNLRPYTLRDFLSEPEKFGAYAGLDVKSLEKADLDKTVSIRFQTTFLPVPEGSIQSIEFAPEAYNYNTRSDEDPRNLVLLCTTQGVAVQQDGRGAKKLFHHAKNSDGKVKRYWLEAESSNHKVGGEQKETKEERDDAIVRGKATSSVIGIEGMGTRFNVLMTIQVPLEQKMEHSLDSQPQLCSAGFGFGGGGVKKGMMFGANELAGSFGDFDEMMGFEESELVVAASSFSAPKKKSKSSSIFKLGSRSFKRSSPPEGKSSAARVSRGSEISEAQWGGLTVKDPTRNDSECITITCVMYYVCQGGTPSEADVASAIDDLEAMYRACEDNGNLAEEKFDFMKEELTVKDVLDINKKITTQPPPKPQGVGFFSSFPIFGGGGGGGGN
ncbi:hypothetical protein TrST_g10262 [Triparma strigata]|uniref:Uncharacterized protein n=1 Tax=Triparma strigata TaxID=1606541 RepID=A0A9W7E1T4_9STRA|nr:hypothetical protein TrST_g10262 [Triparma strigata]